ncbi:MAG: sulfatase [Planctomycetota bacterium]
MRRLALLFALTALGACGGGGTVEGPPNVLLITVDTLRADRLGCYGCDRDTSPELDGFREEAVLFERSYSQAPFTAPSHASLFTSLHTEEHGVLAWGMKLAPEARTYAERFGAKGWRTGAFYNHPSLSLNDLERGFDEVQKRYFEPAEDTVEGFLSFAEQAGDTGEPFAAWVHLWDVHRPYAYRNWKLVQKYVQREPFAFEETRFGSYEDVEVGRTERYYNTKPSRRAELGLPDEAWDFVDARYDSGVWYADRALGALFDGLRDLDLFENTVIVVTSDHGETLRERDSVWYTHDPFLFEETLRVPLLLRLPGGEHGGASVDSLARGIDVLPTLLHAADLPVTGARGRSLLDAVAGTPEEPVYLYAQTQARHPKEEGGPGPDEDGWVERREVVSDGERKLYIDRGTGKRALFDLARDPGEKRDVSADPAYSADLERLDLALVRFRALPRLGTRREDMTPEQIKMLEDMGYL